MSSLNTMGSTSGVIKPKPMNPAMYGQGTVSIGNTQTSTPSQGQNGVINLGSSNNPTASLGINRGLLDTHAPTTAVKSKTDAQGNKVDFHAPDTTTTTTTPTATGAKTYTQEEHDKAIADALAAEKAKTPQVGTQTQNAQNVLDVSDKNALAEGASSASALYGMLGNERKLAPFSGGTTQSLDQSYANLTRPQSVGSFNTKSNLFDVQNGILQNAANTRTDQALQSQRIGQAGAQSVLSAGAPITGVQYGTQTIDPLTGKNIATDAGQFGSGPQAAANVQSAKDQASQINAYKSAQQQGQNLAAQATDLITTFGLNPSEINKVNGAIQLIAANTSNPQYKMLNNYLADISSRYSQILTPPGGTSTDTTRAVASGMLDSLASGSSLKQVLDSLDQQANAVIAGVPTSFGNNSSGGSTGGGNGIYSF